MDMETISVHNTVADTTVLPGEWVQREFRLLYFQQLLQQRKPLPTAIIFVVDSVRPDTLEDAKQDMDGAMSIPDIKESLDLEDRVAANMRWHIRATETCLGSENWDGLIWLDSQLSASPSAITTS
ncbi:hypothetical protein BGZ96_002052 [Linnemannia gamsii]|uniref:Uncharacterized protein n=1 Tax=Linnemannia gamsii TaxID=64522 RepID=A0ABQ7JL79_9FUNG|nr:hypothetical protein BGZ96_002052 [Linnemannia gamsii]